MGFSWQEIASAANLLASLSVFSGIIVYKLERSDTAIYNVQRAIIKFRANVQALDRDFRTELFSEMAASTIYADSLVSIYPKILTELNNSIKEYQSLSRKKQDAFLKTASVKLIKLIGGVPTSVATPLVLRTEDRIEELIKESLPFTPQFAGLERVATTVYHLYFQLLNKYRAICLDLKNWEVVFKNIISNEAALENVEELKYTLCIYLAALQNTIAAEHDQADIDNVVKIVNLICNAYLSKSIHELKKLRKSKVSLLPFESSDTYVEQFAEAQKAFREVLSRDEENAYSNYVKEFEMNNQ